MEKKKRKAGRPRVLDKGSTYFSIAVPLDHIHALEDWAWRLRITRSELCRRLIVNGLKPYYDEGLSPAETSSAPSP